MKFPGSPPLCLPVFSGQGIASINAAQTRQQALLDASSTSGSVLLSACHEVFHAELSSLPLIDLLHVRVDIADFRTRESLVALPKNHYFHNAVISNSSLFLIQSLRYLAFVEATALSTGSLSPFTDILKRNLEFGLGIVGFSSGILPACVVGTSFSLHKFISTAVEAYRLALWIGIRSQFYRQETLARVSLDQHTPLPWSVVLMGVNREYAENSILDFNKAHPETPCLYVTAIVDTTCVTVSGRPDILADFAAQIASKTNLVIHKTTLDTLYHSPIHANGLREQVLTDVRSRNIHFPSFSDLKASITSTFTGNSITKDERTGTLLEMVVDMILTQPVNWNLVVDQLSARCPSGASLQVINVGPGTGLARLIEKSLPDGLGTTIDLTVACDNTPRHAQAKQEPIAIIGMAVNMPGAPNASKLWEVLEQGINTISEIPEHRFKVSDYRDGKDRKRPRMKASTGNFVDGVDEFDNKFFKISPREARSMDPQQRMLLHTAYEALEDSGYVPDSTPTFRPETFGCYIGVATHDYIQNLREDIDVYYSTGTLKAFNSGRISYAMGLSGPSIVVDTACSSSNVAVYQGARALMNRDCDAALVGGVNIVSSPEMFLGLDRGHFLSPTGQCKAFDASADGYSRAEGCGIFVLKRLSDAVAENDRIMGVIRGIEVNQSGQAHSITHPHPPTQALLFKRLLDNSGMDAIRINVVEAHGTGTQAGDPAELEAIRGVLSRNRPPSNPLHVTSIKANIGHLEAASGAAGLAKLLLMLKNKIIPRQLSLETLNPRIPPLEIDNTIIDVMSVPWTPSPVGATRVALLNNFGAAGSNTALLLEEHLDSPRLPEAPDMHFVFGMSAKDEVALEALRTKYLHFLRSSDGASLPDVVYTSTARRQLHDHRLAVSASSIGDLAEKLSKALPVMTKSKKGRVVFVFSGQGGQYLGMGRLLYRTTPLFKQHIDYCHNILIKAGFPGVLSIINVDTGAQTSGLSVLEEFEAYQAAIFSLEYALAQLWISWGISPVAVVGHSLGEYAALAIADVLSLDHALFIVAKRVRLMVQQCAVNSTGMIAVNLGPGAVEDLLQLSPDFAGLSISCYNSPIDCVVSGPLLELRAFKAHLDKEVGCKSILLTVPFGYHSCAMSPLREDLTAFARLVALNAPTIPVVSTVLGDLVLPGDKSVFDSEYFARHCEEPVQFEKGIRSLMSMPSFEPVDAWIEIGPHTTTLPMLKSNNGISRGSTLLGSLRKQQDCWSTLAASLSQLYTSGIHLNWRGVFSHLDHPKCISLPSYPFTKSKFWVPYKEPAHSSEPESRQSADILQSRPPRKYQLLDTWLQSPSKENDFVAIFETPIKKLARSIVGHRVGGMPLCPASVYIEQVLAGIHLACNHLEIDLNGSHVALRRMDFSKPLVYDEDVERIVITTITINEGSGMFSVSSRAGPSLEESVHCHGQYQLKSRMQTATKFAQALPMISRRMENVIHPSNGRTPEVFSTRTAYDVIFPRVVDYAKGYHTMRSITVDTNGMEGCANVSLPIDRDRGNFVVHPVFIDTLLHVAGFVANLQGAPNDAYICNEVHSLKVVPDLVDRDASYTVYCNNSWMPDKEGVLSEAYAVLSSDPRQIVAYVKGMQFRRVRLDRLKRGLVHAAGKTSLLPPFEMKPPAKPKLPRLEGLGIRPVVSTSENDSTVSGLVFDTISRACDISIEDLYMATELEAIGVDSLMSIEILARLRSAFSGANLHTYSLSLCKTIGDIVREVSVKTGSDLSKGSPSTESSGIFSPRTPTNDDILFNAPHLPVYEPDVKQVLATVLEVGVSEIEEDAEFESLGLDSLSSIEALHTLRHDFGLDLPSNLFSIYQTPRTVQSYVATHTQASRKSVDHVVLPGATAREDKPGHTNNLIRAIQIEAEPVLLQESDSGQTPLFLIHDGSGLVNYYRRLAPLGRRIWGIQNPRFAAARPWDDIVSMAKSYADSITDLTAGPLILGGWSFGGVLAFETARQLQTKNIHVQGILLIDSPAPVNHVPLSDSLIDAVIDLDTPSSRSPDLRTLMKAQFTMSARMLGEHNPEINDRSYLRTVLLRSEEGFNLPNVPCIPLWLKDRSNPREGKDGWEALVNSPVKVIDIPGNHFQPFHPSHIHEVSLRMLDGCKYLEGLE